MELGKLLWEKCYVTVPLKVTEFHLVEDSSGGSQVKPIELCREAVCSDTGETVQHGHFMEVDARMRRETREGSLGGDCSKPWVWAKGFLTFFCRQWSVTGGFWAGKYCKPRCALWKNYGSGAQEGLSVWAVMWDSLRDRKTSPGPCWEMVEKWHSRMFVRTQTHCNLAIETNNLIKSGLISNK